MIDLERAKNIVKEHFPKAQPKAAYMYGKKYYLIVAPSGENDMNDPFYIVSVANGDYRFLNPLEDIDLFNETMENGSVKTFD